MNMYSHEVGDDFLKEIGHIAVSYASMEFEFELLVIGLINESQRIGQIITSELSFKQKRSLAVSIAKEKFGEGEELENLKALVGEAQSLEQERNRIFHSGWGVPVDEQTRIVLIKLTAKEKHGFKVFSQDFKLGQLRAIGDKMLELASRIGCFMDDLASSGKIISPYEL